MAAYDRVVLPFGKWAPDEHFLAESGNLDVVENLLYHDGAWARVHTPFTLKSLAERHEPSAALAWSDEGGSNRVAIGFADLAITNGHLFAYDIGAATLVDRCKLGHYQKSHWDFVKFGQSVIASNNLDPVQLFNFTAASVDLITSTTKPKGKYLCACRGHVILAYISAPAANARQFRWSALNNAANWEPGSNRSGFGEIPGDAGVITGLAGFEDFFLIFTTTSVYRASYIGGADVWSLQQVAGWHDGLPEGFDQSIIEVDRNAYYLGRSGPKAIFNGEAVRDLGVGSARRYLMDFGRSKKPVGTAVYIDRTIPFGARAWGAHDGFRQMVYWFWHSLTTEGTNFYWTSHLYGYSLKEDAFSYVSPESLSEVIGGFLVYYGPIFPRPGDTKMTGGREELGYGLCYVTSDDISANQTLVKNLGGATSYLNGVLYSKFWRPSNAKTSILAVRPLWRSQRDGGETNPLVTVTINEEQGGPTGSGSGSDVDDRGFISFSTGPYAAAEFQFKVTISDNGGVPSAIRDFVGLELELSVEKSARGGD
jgi:hypothetical protein